MSRYIDAEETLKAMDTWDKFGILPNGTVVSFRNCENADGYVPYVRYEDMVNCIKNMPTADVVEVVRCKDCEFWQTDWLTSHDGYHYCAMVDIITDGDFYCKDGERKILPKL